MVYELILGIAGLSSMIMILAEKWKLWRYYSQWMPLWWWSKMGTEGCDLCRLFWFSLLAAVVINGLTWSTLVLPFAATPVAFLLWVNYVNNSRL